MDPQVVLVFTSLSVDINVAKHYKLIVAGDSLTTTDSILHSASKHKPLAYVSIGSTANAFQGLMEAPMSVRKRWVHCKTLSDLTPDLIDHCVFGSLKHTADEATPLVSVVSSSYCSGDRILRPWTSLQAQTYKNWEWVIWDDSPDDETYQRLLKFATADARVRVFKAPRHSGRIGELKRLACGSAYGSLLVEVDHDDDLDSRCLEWIVAAAKAHPEAQFFFTDCVEVYEGAADGGPKSHSYGDGYAYGLGSQVHVWVREDWHVQQVTAPLAEVSKAHLVGLPNHVRAWRTAFYDKIGKHNPMLTVADDYDLLVRSMEAPWCHIPEAAYFQYRNREGSNFTFLRNDLIQHNVNWLRHQANIPTPVFQGPLWASNAHGKMPARGLQWRPFSHYSALVVGRQASIVIALVKKALEKHRRVLVIVTGLPDIGKSLREFCDGVGWWNLAEPHDWPTSALRYAELITGTPLKALEEAGQQPC